MRLAKDFIDDITEESYTQLKERMEDKEKEFAQLQQTFEEREAEIIETYNMKEIDLCQQLVDYQLEIESYKKQLNKLAEQNKQQQVLNSRTEQSFNHSLQQFKQVREKLETERNILKEQYIKITNQYNHELKEKEELIEQLGIGSLQGGKFKANATMSLRYGLYELKQTNGKLKSRVQVLRGMLADGK
ncbi:hypothetical protein RV10_GL004737 [Enterococcus pallens]|nr:hypothetical protein RV10_GL004737 [Enterococcus pallens]